jgi:hypothetical protein
MEAALLELENKLNEQERENIQRIIDEIKEAEEKGELLE